MSTFSILVSAFLRGAELTAATVVAGVVGSYLNDYDSGNGWPLARLIYIEIIAGISILLSLVWLFPFSNRFLQWPTDVLLSFAWFASFGLLINFADDSSCRGDRFFWRDDFVFNDFCARFRTAEAFTFSSAIFWIVSAFAGLTFARRQSRKVLPGGAVA